MADSRKPRNQRQVQSNIPQSFADEQHKSADRSNEKSGEQSRGAAGEEPTESKMQRRAKVTKRAAGQIKRVSSQQEPANVPRPNCSPAKGTLVDALARTVQPKTLTSECSKHGQKNSKSKPKKEAKSAHTRHNASVAAGSALLLCSCKRQITCELAAPSCTLLCSRCGHFSFGSD
jgi:hypothetical protein